MTLRAADVETYHLSTGITAGNNHALVVGTPKRKVTLAHQQCIHELPSPGRQYLSAHSNSAICSGHVRVIRAKRCVAVLKKGWRHIIRI